jgi:hypothetical protein
LTILAAIFSGGGGGGDRKGKEKGKEDSGVPGQGPAMHGEESGSGASGPIGPNPNVKVDPDGAWEVEGSWPKFTLVSRADSFDRCSIDFSQVEREDNPWSPDPAATIIVSGECDRGGGRHSITVQVIEGSNEAHYYKGTLSEGIWNFVSSEFNPNW